MKLRFITVFLVFFLFFFSVPPQWSQVLAQSPVDFYSSGVCDSPESCQCLYAIRNNETRDISWVYGSVDQNDLGHTLTGIPPGDYSISTFVYEPRNDSRTDNCYFEQQQATQSFDESALVPGAGVGCAVGTLTLPIPGGGCIVGGLIGAVVTEPGEFLDGVNNLTVGYWDGGINKSGENSCGWNDDETMVTPWRDYEFRGPGNPVRVDIRGHRGTAAYGDEYYCGLLTAEYTRSDEITQNLSKEDINNRRDENSGLDPTTYLDAFNFCKQIPSSSPMFDECGTCVSGGGLYTAVGCITVDPKGEGLASDLIRLLLGVGGGIGLLSILAAAFIFTTSQGDTSKVKQAKELMTAAVSGLLFIIFSVIILDFIGVRILMIPGLG